MKPRFKFLTGDCNWLSYGGKWVSQKGNKGDFDYWLVLELVNMDEACGRDNIGKPRYYVSLSVVSPQQAGNEDIKKATEGYDGIDFSANPLIVVEALHGYGIFALVWQGKGNNAHKLLKQAKQEAIAVECLFGFYLDRPVNRIGTTGWEALTGDITAGLRRTVESGSTEGQILKKMHNL